MLVVANQGVSPTHLLPTLTLGLGQLPSFTCPALRQARTAAFENTQLAGTSGAYHSAHQN